VGEGGRTCRPVDVRGKLAEQPFDIEVVRESRGSSGRGTARSEYKVLVRFRGRLVRTLTGADADAVCEVIDDPDQLQLVVARRTGNFKRGNER
jgi:hypothetical protein